MAHSEVNPMIVDETSHSVYDNLPGDTQDSRIDREVHKRPVKIKSSGITYQPTTVQDSLRTRNDEHRKVSKY